MSKYNLERIIELHKTGLNQTQIGLEFGVTQPTISKIMRDAGVAPGKGKWRRKEHSTPEHRKRYRMGWHVQKKYGLSLEEYEIKKAKSPLCAICKTPDPNHLDHNDNTGQVREFLCNKCNMGIGLFNHDPALLKEAILYLEVHN